MEQRWLARKDDPVEDGFDEYKFENTFRYMLQRTFVFNPKIYGILFGEIHLRTMTFEPEKVLDQNRLFAGVGFNLDKRKWWRIETGYMYQLIYQSSPESNGKQRVKYVFRVYLVSDIPFSH